MLNPNKIDEIPKPPAPISKASLSPLLSPRYPQKKLKRCIINKNYTDTVDYFISKIYRKLTIIKREGSRSSSDAGKVKDSPKSKNHVNV